MPNTVVEIIGHIDIAGQTAFLSNPASSPDDIVNNSGNGDTISATGYVNRQGVGSITIDESLTGLHYLWWEDGDSIRRGWGWVWLRDDTGTYYVRDSREEAENDRDYFEGKNGTEIVTKRTILEKMFAVLAGKVTGARSGTEKFFAPDGTTEEVRSSPDSSGNRTVDISP